MSTSAPDAQEQARQEIHLTDKQVEGIINYAVENKMYDGNPPDDPELKRRDAATLVYQARRARDNGSKNEHVTELCFIADSDMNPPSAGNGAPPPQAAPPAIPPAPSQPAPPAQEAPTGPDISQKSDDELRRIVAALEPQKEIQAVGAEIDRINAELTRRQSAQAAPAQPTQEVPPPAQAPPAPPQPPAVPGEQASAAVPPPSGGGQGTLPEGATDAEGQPRQRIDAPVDPSHETPQPGQQGVTHEAPPSTETGAVPPPPVAPGTPGTPAITPERAKLEEQVTGPMLKAWKRGRVDVVGLSDDELRTMVENPTGPPSNGATAQAPVAPPTLPQAPSIPETPPAQAPPVAPSAMAVGQDTSPPQDPSTVGVPAQPQSGEAEDIVRKENLPIPPEVEQPPTLPFDLSKLSDAELRSLHGQFHAVLCRANWVIAHRKDLIDDLEQSLNLRRAQVQNEMPASIDGKRVTKDGAAALIESDGEVQRIKGEIVQAKKPLRKIEVVADNARSTCARASREWSMRYKEETGQHGTP